MGTPICIIFKAVSRSPKEVMVDSSLVSLGRKKSLRILGDITYITEIDLYITITFAKKEFTFQTVVILILLFFFLPNEDDL